MPFSTHGSLILRTWPGLYLVDVLVEGSEVTCCPLGPGTKCKVLPSRGLRAGV